MNFLGVGVGELLLILVIAMLVVGPERMVELAGQAGRMLAKFREQSDSITREFKEAFTLELDEVKEVLEAVSDPALLEGAAAPAVVEGVAKEALPAGDGNAPEAGEAPVPDAPEPSPEEIALFEALQLEERLASDRVDGEVEVALAGLSAGSNGSAADDDDDSYHQIQPVDLDLAVVVPEDQDVEPTAVNDVLVFPDEDELPQLPLEAEG